MKTKNQKQVRPSILLRQRDGFQTLKELAEQLGVAPSTVFSWSEMGTIPRPSHKWRHHERCYYTTQEVEKIKNFLKGKE